MAAKAPDAPAAPPPPPPTAGPPPPYTGPSNPPPYQPEVYHFKFGGSRHYGSPTATGMSSPMTTAHFGPYPVSMRCPHCACNITTEILPLPGLLTYILSGGILLLGCWLGCCLIPCCIPECQDIEHRCPHCKNFVGIYRRL